MRSTAEGGGHPVGAHVRRLPGITVSRINQRPAPPGTTSTCKIVARPHMKLLMALSSFTAVMLAQAPPNPNAPAIVPRPAGAQIKVPAGFSVDEYASGFARPRFMVEGAGGEVLVSDTVPNGSVIALRGGAKKVLISGLDRPYGLALWKEYLYVGEPESLKRFKYDSKTLVAGPGEEVVSMAGFSKGHVTRTIL